MADSDPLDTGPFDPDELVEWAESYGHPEGWAKRAQEAHGRAEKAEAKADDREHEAAMARHNEGVNRERTERAEGLLAEATRLLGEAVGFVGVRQPLDYDSEVEADQVRIRVENFLSREVESE